ncbi:hypothetical protein [Thaumasiovibrio sp. DFM-14]|uniref:hypothetical protein n=1 Tax=Thaumasiovibrio sp. DFM-14 TaxID=3384792 RepID=UPI0039A16475
MKKLLIGTSLLITCTQINANSFEGVITAQAKEWGVNQCLQEIKKMDGYLNENAGPNGAWSFSSSDNPSERLFSALNIRKYNDGTWGYATLSIAPGTDGRCDSTLMQMVTFPDKSCNALRETGYKDYEYKGDIAGKSIYESGSTKAVLEELNGGCISIRYEALYPSPI